MQFLVLLFVHVGTSTPLKTVGTFREALFLLFLCLGTNTSHVLICRLALDLVYIVPAKKVYNSHISVSSAKHFGQGDSWRRASAGIIEKKSKTFQRTNIFLVFPCSKYRDVVVGGNVWAKMILLCWQIASPSFY